VNEEGDQRVIGGEQTERSSDDQHDHRDGDDRLPQQALNRSLDA
jgi:hypothetical protein